MPHDGEGADWIVFPRERPGRNYSLNWQLRKAMIAPFEDAYDNLKQESVAKMLGIEPKGASLPLPALTAGFAMEVVEAGSEKLEFEDYDVMEAETRDKLQRGNLYVATGFLGSHQGARLWTRVVSDHPAVALMAERLMHPSPFEKYEHGESPVPIITLYACTASSDVAAVQYTSGQGDAIIGATGVLGGKAALSLGTLTSALSMVSSALLLETPNTIPLPAAVLRKGAATGLLFGAGPAEVADAKAASALYCAAGCVWSPPVGVGALWGGVSLPAASSAGSVDGKWAVKVEEIAVDPYPTPNVVFPPKAVFFLGGKGAPKSMSEDDVKEAISKVSSDADVISRFTAALSEGKVSCFSVSSVKAAVEKLA